MITRSDLLRLIVDPICSFDEKALALFDYQYKHNLIYHQFINIVRYNGFRPSNVREIPYFPITLFKSRKVKSGEWKEQVIFNSSRTPASVRSNHYVRDLKWYIANTKHIWNQFFRPVEDYAFISLLPSYHQQKASSLLYMVDGFMNSGIQLDRHYFLNDYKHLHASIETHIENGHPIVLFGVSFALLEYVAMYQHSAARNVTVIETGGMKKRGKSITREELHNRLSKCFVEAQIVSEYGMTECLSQMYSLDSHFFLPNDRMHIEVTDPTDPGVIVEAGRRGKINIIDLANIDSVAFIATDDLGFKNDHNEVAILGRLDNSDIRGCNYLI